MRIAYVTSGPADGEPLLLVAGLGAQLLSWHEDLVEGFHERGFRVVRFDNRDVGLSTHLRHAGPPDLLRGDPRGAAYLLGDMARDAVGLLDHLGVRQAHVLGVSMGGMIAQTLAIVHPERVRTLTSVMSTTAPSVGAPTPAARAAMLAAAGPGREGAIERSLATYRAVASPGWPLEEERERRLAGQAYDRAYDPPGVGRQLVAINASGDRAAALRGLRSPTLVFHGEADPLVQVAGGRATAAAVPGARLVTVPGMGHDLPRAVRSLLLDAVRTLAH